MFDRITEKFKNDWRIPILSGLIFIQTKDMKLVPLKVKPAQKELIDLIWKTEQEGKPVRIALPKARQLGFSTLICAITYVKTAYNDNINALIIADLIDKSTELFMKCSLIHDMMYSKLKKQTYKSNSKEIRFRHRSIIKISSAEIKRAGRGNTYQIFHASEIAFFSDPETLMTGVMQSIPDLPGTMVILESTGNGIGGYFYDVCKKAEIKQNAYTLFFVPWFDDPDYKMDIPEGYDCNWLSEGQYGDELYYKTEFNLSDEQLYWRRWQITNKLNGDIMKFMQEYPATLDECFIASGLPVFNIIKLNEMEKQAIEPTKTGYLDNHNFIDSFTGWLKIYKNPETGWKNRYLVVCDTGGHWEGADYGVILVFDRVKKEVSAIAHGHFDDYEFADYAVDICKMYNNAVFVLEINKWASETEDSTTLLNNILRHIKYTNHYRRKVYDNMTKTITMKPGFHTNKATKKMIVDRLRKAINENENIKINDHEIYQEMKTYIIASSKTGKTQYQAQDGCKDDRVMTLGISLVVDDELPKPIIINIEDESLSRIDYSSPY